MQKQIGLILLLCSQLVISCSSCYTKDDMPKKVHTALMRVLNYISDNVQDMNLDGLFGVVLVKAQLGSIKNIRPSVMNIRDFYAAQNKTSEILRNVPISDMELSDNKKLFAKYLLDSKIWRKDIYYTCDTLNKKVKISTTNFDLGTCKGYKEYLINSNFSEELSDECLAELLITSVDRPHNCIVGRKCSDYMMTNEIYTPGYGITHKLLFLQIADARRCDWNKELIESRIKEYCSYILWEIETNAACGFLSELDDLLLEQIMVCGYEGFMEFLSRQWMKRVLKMQKAHGCFGIRDGSVLLPNEINRRKRESNEMKYGCIDHTTGLGAAVLSLFLRFLIEENIKV